MRAAAPPLLPIFRSRLQGELLALVLADPARQWTIDELADRTGEPYPTVATEANSSAITNGGPNAIVANWLSGTKYGLASFADSSFVRPIVVATNNSASCNRRTSVAAVDAIFVYGSWASRLLGHPGPAPNDIDVLVIGRPDRDEVFDAAQRVQRRVGREVNVTQRTRDQWDTANDGFSAQVKNSPMVEVPYPRDRGAVEQGQ